MSREAQKEISELFFFFEFSPLCVCKAPLDGTILPGVTRESILELARADGMYKVSERKFYMDEVIRAIKEDRVIEMFGAG